MALIEICPLPAALVPVPAIECSFRLDQLNRLLLFRSAADLSVGEEAIDATDLTSRATYEALLAATGVDKAVLTPLFAEAVIPPSESNFTGGDTNETIGGVPEYNGESAVQATAAFHSIPPSVVSILQGYSQYSDATKGYIGLRAFFFNENGKVFFLEKDGVISGIPLYSFAVSNPGTEGLKTQTKNILRFTLPHNWAQGLTSANLDFDYKSLVNVIV